MRNFEQGSGTVTLALRAVLMTMWRRKRMEKVKGMGTGEKTFLKESPGSPDERKGGCMKAVAAGMEKKYRCEKGGYSF